MKYIEVGIGNTWVVRTETELADGSEFEQRLFYTPSILEYGLVRKCSFGTPDKA